MEQIDKNQKIQELRKRTSAGILDCKKALDQSDYDLEKAVEWLKKNGIAKAAKKGGAIAAEGIVEIKRNHQTAVLYEVNCQTDFVSKNHDFIGLIDQIGNILLKNNFKSVEETLSLKDNSNLSIYDLTLKATSILGEKIVLRRALKVQSLEHEIIGSYVHKNKIGAIVVLDGGNDEIAKQIAMHVVSINPAYLDQTAVPNSIIEQFNQEIYNSPALLNKPENIKNNIAQGMLNKKLGEITLVNQPFVIDNSLTVAQFLAKHHARVISMNRFELAEGIEKQVSDFASEVAEQISKSNQED